MKPRTAALIFCALTTLVVIFELALALGAPWGRYAMGGAYPGVLPPAVRGAAAAQAAILAVFGAVIAARARAGAPRPLRWGAWLATGLMGVSVVLNLITPSAGERMIWAPVALVLFACALRVALTPISAASPTS